MRKSSRLSNDQIAVLAALKRIKLKNAGIPEDEIHDAIKEALSKEGIIFEHQPRIGPRSIPDFFTASGIVIEVKKGRPPAKKTLEQLERYATLPNVKAIILITERGLPVLPKEINGKTLQQITTYSSWGIAV